MVRVLWLQGVIAGGAAALLLILWLWARSLEQVDQAMAKSRDGSAAVAVSHGGGRVVLGCRIAPRPAAGAAGWAFTTSSLPMDETDEMSPWFPPGFLRMGKSASTGAWGLSARVPYWMIAGGHVLLWSAAMVWAARARARCVVDGRSSPRRGIGT